MKGQDAVLEARVWSFWEPQKNRWDAPGLGNTEDSIRHDQKRRMLAIARVLTVYQHPSAARVAQSPFKHWFNPKPAAQNPYSIQIQRQNYLWWEAGYWDAKLNRGRQVPEGYEAAYDEGFRSTVD